MKNIVRERRIQKAGSPYFNLELPTIPPQGIKAYMVTDVSEAARKYLPLDYIEVTNLAIVDVMLCLDDGDSFIIPHGTIKSIEDKPFRRFRITNRDITNETGNAKVLIQMQRLPITIDTWIRKFKIK